MSKQLNRVVWMTAAIVAVVSLAPAPASGQTQDGAAAGWASPRTPWGDPDLQGIWDYWTFTPLERPDEFAGREELTDGET